MDKVAIKKTTQAPGAAGRKKYTYEEARAAATEYFHGDVLPAGVWCDKYAMRDKEGNFLELTPHDMHDRLASEFARIDSEKYGLNYDERFKVYRHAMDQFSLIVPQGSPMAAVGNTEQIMSASNCVVVASPSDSIEGIMKAGTDLAQLMKRRCGVGLDISTLRPDGFRVNNAAKTTSGAFSFADFYSYVTRMIAQKGRRGALMVTIDVHHPDVIKFAKMKSDLSKVTGANVSIRLSDEFLEAVDKGTTYEQRWPLENPTYTKEVDAREVWEVIVTNACHYAEPGLIFWDKMCKRLPACSYPQFKSVSTNPCSEISLSEYDSCRLISLNLTGFVKNAFTEKSRFDFEAFKDNVFTAMQMIDNLVDLELELIEKIQAVCSGSDEKELWQKLWQAGHDGRRTGLGTHGLGDMLAQLCIKYDSQEALDFVDKLYCTLRDTAYTASIDLAEERGAFPAFDWEIDKTNEFIQDLPKPILKRMAKVGRRNISILTQAPTGSVSLVSKCGEFDRHNISSGVEPVFRNNFTRRKRVNVGDESTRVDFVDDLGDKWQNFDVYHGNVLNYFEKMHNERFEDLESLETQNRLKQMMKDELPDFFVSSDQVDWRFRIKLQGTEQVYIDHSISSTVNLPKGTSPQAVAEIYMEGWKQNLKGVTVYVDGSRSGVLVTDESDNKIDITKRPEKVVRLQAPKRPKELPIEIHHHTVKGEKWIAFVGLLNGEPYEMFGGYSELIHLPKKYKHGVLKRRAQAKYDLHIPIGDEELVIRDILGTFNDDEIGWTTRLVSTSLRHGVPLEFLVEQLLKAEGGLNSFSKVLARVLKKYIPDGEVRSSAACAGIIEQNGKKVPCKSRNLKYQEGCPTCMDCGYTKCN